MLIFLKLSLVFRSFCLQNLDLTKRKLIHQGNLNLRITNKQKLIELYVLLLEDLIILLQKSHEKYLLQFFPSGGPNDRGMCPVIKVSSNIIVRRNAVGKYYFFHDNFFFSSHYA